MDEIVEILSLRINKIKIRIIVEWALKERKNINMLYQLTKADDKRLSTNALWCLTHLPKTEANWLQIKQNELIDSVLIETYTAKKRLLLQLLREQNYDKSTLRSDFIDFCFSKINSESEPYAVRCFCIYCAFKMCKSYPELINELKEYLNLLSYQNISPGLNCAIKSTRKEIMKLFN